MVSKLNQLRNSVEPYITLRDEKNSEQKMHARGGSERVRYWALRRRMKGQGNVEASAMEEKCHS